MPILDSIAKQSNSNTFSFVKIDLEENRMDSISFGKVPRLEIYMRSDKRNPQVFNGDFTMKKLQDFISNSNATNTKIDL